MSRVLGNLLLATLALGGCRAAPAEERSQSGGGGQIASAVQSAVAAGATPVAPLGWPELLPEEVELDIRPRKRPIVVYLDAGHGAKDNPGNTSCFCVEEQQFTLSLSMDVAADLEELGAFEVIQSRREDQLVQYGERVDTARRARADVFVSLHSDIRGDAADEWSPDGAAICRRSVEAPGFSVLYSDEGTEHLVTSRRRLADSIASALLEAQFIPYLGAEYKNLYEPIPSETGVFVDRHEDKKRIFVLRRTTMPAVIVETHNALDPREALAFEDPIVRRLFSRALAKGILVAMEPPAQH